MFSLIIPAQRVIEISIFTRYELASGESYLCQGDLGRALKKFLAVEKHYADITQDQFDFRSYCLRKTTLRAYIEMLKFQDRLHSHTYFYKAAAGAIRCYVKLYDDEMLKLPASQKKKMRQKQRKAEARAKKEAEVKNEESSVNVSKSGKRDVDIEFTGSHIQLVCFASIDSRNWTVIQKFVTCWG